MPSSRITLYHFAELNGMSFLSIAEKSFSECEMHGHDFFEFEYIIEGEILMCQNGDTRLLRPGDLVFSTPSAFHSYEPSESSPGIRTITVQFNIDNLDRQLTPAIPDADIIHCSDELRYAFTALSREKKTGDAYTTLACKNMLERILILFLRAAAGTSGNAPADEIMKAISYVNKNFTRPINLGDMCAISGYSTSHFCRRFKEITGDTFVEYVNKMRLDCARRLLVSSETPVIQICFDCGFSSIRHFNREFKMRYGISPSEYRESHIQRLP